MRKGFVSNSSSSSFIIAIKGELTVERLMRWAKIAEDSPLNFTVYDILSCLINSVDFKYTDAEMYAEGGGIGKEDVDREAAKYLKDGFAVHVGTLHTDSGVEDELTLAMMDIDYESDDLIIKHKARQ